MENFPNRDVGGDSAVLALPSAESDFSATRVLYRTWRIFLTAPAFFMGLAVIPAIPAYFGAVAEISLTALALTTIEPCLGLLLQAVVTSAVYRSLRGEKVTAEDALRKGFRRFFPVLSTSLVAAIVIVVGHMFLFIPGLIFACFFVVTIPVCVVERAGPLDSMQRSFSLTKGCRWTVFLLIAVVLAVSFSSSFILLPLSGYFRESNVVSFLLVRIPTFIPSAFGNIMAVVLYFTLREVKEGVSAESLATVFE
ncbi:MAG: hypothetical protein LIQ31_05200 [Planctomycetes bacterium]|nr:hypothetical protein [Planctomycetota bacterium]